MKPYQFVGYMMINASAITALATTNNIIHGLRPQSSALSALPAINFYELGNGTRQYGIETQPFSINCRAVTPAAARDLARVVVDTFHGTTSTGMYGVVNEFDVARVSLRADQGLIPEPDNAAYNAPVDIQLIYPSSTVS